MKKMLSALAALGLLASGVPVVAQEPREPAESVAEDPERPVVRRFPSYYQSYYGPGGAWTGSYRRLGYYVLDEDGLPIGRNRRAEPESAYFAPDWGSGYGVGWDSPQGYAGWNAGQAGWNPGWSGWTDGWNAWTGGSGLWAPYSWDGKRSHRQHGGAGHQAPRPAPRQE